MNNSNNIDDLFRDKLKDENYAFNPAAWEKMEQLIEDDQKKRGGIPWFYGGLVITALLAVGAVFLLDNSKEELATIAANSTQTTETTNQAGPTAGADVVIEEESNTDVTSDDNSSNLLAHVAAPSENEEENVVAASYYASNNLDRGAKYKYVKNEVSEEISKLTKPKSDIKNHLSTPLENRKSSLGSAREPARENSNSKPMPTRSGSMITPSYTSSKKAERRAERAAKKEAQLEARAAAAMEREDRRRVKQILKEIEEENDAIDREEEAYDKMAQLPASIDYEFEDVNNLPSASPMKDRMNWLRRASVGVIGGMHLSPGFLNTGTDNAPWSVGPVVGMRLSYHLIDMFSIDLNVLYSMRMGLNSSTTSLVRNSSTNETVTTTPMTLHYIDLPLYFDYKFDRHSVLLGIQYSQAIGVFSQNYTSSQGYSGSDWSDLNYFSSFDMAAIVGYEYLVHEQVSVGMRFNLGLFDVTDDAYFDNSSRDKNMQFRFLVDYKLFKY